MSLFKQGSETYRSDVVLGDRYRDKQTGIEGHVTAIHFYQHACERVTLKTTNKQGEVVEYGFDAPELVHVTTEAEPRQQRTGGPARATAARREVSR